MRTGLTAAAAVAMAAATIVVGAPAGAATTGTCDRPVTPGLHQIDVHQGGTNRPVEVWVPSGYAGRDVPLLLWLHGSGSSGAEMLRTTDAQGRPMLIDDAEEHGYVLAAPTGAIPFKPLPTVNGFAWNIAGVPLVGTTTYPDAAAPDDVAYLRLVVAAIGQAVCVDPGRVYATGASGGGRMASQLACDAPDRFAAIAPVMGVRTPQASDTPPHTVECGGAAVPTLAIHGTLDPVNPFANDDPRIKPGSSWTYGAPEALRRRAVRNGCDPWLPEFRQVSPNVRYWWFRCPAGADVALYQVLDGGHTLPGSAEIPSLAPFIGPTDRELDAPDAIWDFVSRFRLP